MSKRFTAGFEQLRPKLNGCVGVGGRLDGQGVCKGKNKFSQFLSSVTRFYGAIRSGYSPPLHFSWLCVFATPSPVRGCVNIFTDEQGSRIRERFRKWGYQGCSQEKGSVAGVQGIMDESDFVEVE